MTRISVVIPAYNQSQYLAAAIQSVLEQTFQDFEIVVVDDGSTDDTQEIAASFTDPRFRYIYQKNQGLSAARNTGVKQTNTPYLVFLDSDDLLCEGALEHHLDNLRAHPGAGLSVGGWEVAPGPGAASGTQSLFRQCMPPASIAPEDFLSGNPFPVHSALVARDWFERCGLFDERLNACEDWDLWLRFASAGCAISTINKIVCVYRMHGDQMTRQAARMRTAMLALLDKAFNSPDLPAEWQGLRARAYAAALVKAAARGYQAGLTNQARSDLSRAVELDSSLLARDAAPLADFLAGWAESPLVADPLGYMKAVYQGLPDNLRALKKRRRHDIARLSMQLAFDAYHQGRLSVARHYILQAAIVRPAWLANFGVLSMLMRSFTYSG